MGAVITFRKAVMMRRLLVGFVCASVRYRAAGTGCREGRCIDGRVSAAEACDDGNDVDSDGCTNQCTVAVCGDEVLARTSARSLEPLVDDTGNTFDGDACLSNCLRASCGDEVLRTDLGVEDEGYEACDDGNAENWDGCTNCCEVVGCGDGVVQPEMGETCDDGNEVDTDACTNRCRPAGCGDGSVWEGRKPATTATETISTAASTSCDLARCGDGSPKARCGGGRRGLRLATTATARLG